MIILNLTRNWSTIFSRLKAKFPQLTDGDFHFIEGREDDFVTQLQEKTGASREELLLLLRHP